MKETESKAFVITYEHGKHCRAGSHTAFVPHDDFYFVKISDAENNVLCIIESE